MKLRNWTSAVATIALGACVSATLPLVDDSDVERAQLLFPDTTRERLESGRQTFMLRCGACHEPYQPAGRNPHQWEQAVAKMSERAGLAGERQALVLEYLITFASLRQPTAE